MLTRNITKYALIGVAALGVVFVLTIWLFGGKSSLQTELTKTTSSQLVESLPYIQPNQTANSNLTEEISKRFAKQIVRQNPDGPQLISDVKFLTAQKPEEFVAGSLAAELTAAQARNWRPEIKTTDFKTVPVSKAASEDYIRNLKNILSKNLSSLKVDRENFFATNFDAWSHAYSNAFEELMVAPVPTDLVPYHRQELSLIGMQINIVAALKNNMADPASALVAMQMSESLIKETDTLRVLINNYIEKNKLVV